MRGDTARNSRIGTGRGDPRPRIWVLADDRPGHTTQTVGLAEIVDWPYEIKELRFNPLNRISNWLLGASCMSLDRSRSAALAAPWPDLVIAMGRRTAPIARWIGKQSGGRTRLVQLGRKGANDIEAFDLTVVCSHFRLPSHPKRVTLAVPPTRIDARRLTEVAERWSQLFSGLAKPHIVLIVGGSTAQHRLSPETARHMAQSVQDFADRSAGTLAVITSRRTGPAATAALRAALAPTTTLHAWRADDPENPYLGYLATADQIVVTSESESMLAEAATTGKPLFIYPIPERPPAMKDRLCDAVLRISLARPASLFGAISAMAIRRGIVSPPRDLGLMHQAMVDRGLACMFGESWPTDATGRQPDSLDVANRVRDLVRGE